MLNIPTFKNFGGRGSGPLDPPSSYGLDTTYQIHIELCKITNTRTGKFRIKIIILWVEKVMFKTLMFASIIHILTIIFII